MNMPNHTRKQRIIAWRLWDRTRRYGHGIADASGAALIEFALILPVFIGIIFGLIEVGRVLYTDHALEHATRQAARYAMVRGSMSPTPATTTDIENVVISSATALDPAKMAIAVSYDPDNRPGSLVTVQASYDHQLLIPMYLVKSINLFGSSQRIITY